LTRRLRGRLIPVNAPFSTTARWKRCVPRDIKEILYETTGGIVRTFAGRRDLYGGRATTTATESAGAARNSEGKRQPVHDHRRQHWREHRGLHHRKGRRRGGHETSEQRAGYLR